MVHTRGCRRSPEAGARSSWRDGGGSRPRRHVGDSDLRAGRNRRSWKGSEKEKTEPTWPALHPRNGALDELQGDGRRPEPSREPKAVFPSKARWWLGPRWGDADVKRGIADHPRGIRR